MCYQVLRPLLFCLNTETAHHVTLAGLNVLYRLKLTKLYPSTTQPKTLWNLEFKNSVGLAAGLDKNGDYINALASLGFGFIEIGTVTPKPQPGNPKPRLFRIPEASAIINRMGFNNKGIDYLIENVKKAHFAGILGINIGKNATTPNENALDDYLICLKKAYPYASYITINISSPNTLGLRNLQHGEFLEHLLSNLKAEQARLHAQHQKYVPLLVKIAPDLTEQEVVELADTFKRLKIDGVIATNTTIDKTKIAQYPQAKETGGLSGLPVFEQSTVILRLLKRELQNAMPIIAAGGIMNAEMAAEKIAAGADLIQLYTGLIYKGPALIHECTSLFTH